MAAGEGPSLGKRLRRFRDFVTLYTIYQVAGMLPWASLGRWGRRLGRLAWYLAPVRKSVVLDNLTHAFGDELSADEIRALARRFYETLGITLLEFCALRRMDADRIGELIVIENESYLEELRARGQGAILVSGHFGNWELMGAAINARGYPIRFLAKTQANPYIDRIQNELRAGSGLGIIRIGPSLKEMIRALRGGALMGMLADQDAGPQGHFTSFMGRPASVYRGPAIYAHRFGYPLMTGFTFRQEDGTHLLRINPPHRIDPDWDEETVVARLTEAHTRDLETAVRAAPENYWWVHRRWKTRPPTETATTQAGADETGETGGRTSSASD